MHNPEPTSGAELLAHRKSMGVRQVDLAKALRVSRVTLHRWERETQVDAIRAARYRRAVDDLVAQAVA